MRVYEVYQDCLMHSLLFDECEKLKTLDLSSFDTRNVQNMKYMFWGDINLETINFSSFNTKNVTDMSYMFTSCWNLKNLDLSGFDTRNVQIFDMMFYGCVNLTATITISSTNVNSYSGIFAGRAATGEGSRITLNYTNTTSSLVDQMIATKSNESNIVKGILVS